jgi:hypothetical protein
MKTRLLAALAVLTIATTASADVYDAAEPPVQKSRYVGVTTSGGVGVGLFRLGANIDAGLRLGSSPWFVRAQFATGLSAGFQTSGVFTELRGGLEARHCAGYVTRVCVLAGADAGASHDSIGRIDDTSMSSSSVTPMIIPRASLEVGNTVRMRTIVEVPMVGGSDPGTGVTLALGVSTTF